MSLQKSESKKGDCYRCFRKMETGRLWRSHRRRDFKYFGLDWDYWPMKMTQRSSVAFLEGTDFSQFDFTPSDDGQENFLGDGLNWFWHKPFDFVDWYFQLLWQIPTMPTKDHGHFDLELFEAVNGADAVIRANIDDCIRHDDRYRWFQFLPDYTEIISDDNGMLEFGTWSEFNFWPWTYQDET